jgi:cation diffusion facilitator CzcD-associated flavoprotein CzcO
VLIGRRFPFGIPGPLFRWALWNFPDWIQKPILQYIAWQPFRDLHKLGIQSGRNRQERLGMSAPVTGRELYDALKSGKIQPVKALARLSGHCAETADGQKYAVDAVILATGYRPAIDYLDIEYEPDFEGWPARDAGQEVAGYPGLYIVGRFYQGLGPVNNMRDEAQVIVKQLERRLAAVSREAVVR